MTPLIVGSAREGVAGNVSGKASTDGARDIVPPGCGAITLDGMFLSEEEAGRRSGVFMSEALPVSVVVTCSGRTAF